MNAIFVFVASGLLAKMMGRIKVDAAGEVSVWSWIFKNVFNWWLPSQVASLSMAVCFILFFWLILRWMYQKKIFLKV
jgi:predicted acyltransferase